MTGFSQSSIFVRFEPEAGMRLLAYVKALSLSSDHRTNYRLLWLLWQAQIDLEIASAHEVGGREFTQLQEKLFPEFARIFDTELRPLGGQS
ncbi:hypothetical protein ACSBOB_17315 [Mesorhizobium sp. ASY16-5R]|uniref:hypothetical protein n=1 Tax=Mesorhizobium sp. ASY16-5R TaxID=3445772 RepID=UPI003FA0F718